MRWSTKKKNKKKKTKKKTKISPPHSRPPPPPPPQTREGMGGRGPFRKQFNLVHCNENLIYVFPEKELGGLSPNFHIHVSVNDLYRSTYFPTADEADRFAHRHIKLGLKPRNPFSGNICLKFSVLCLCSVAIYSHVHVAHFNELQRDFRNDRLSNLRISGI